MGINNENAKTLAHKRYTTTPEDVKCVAPQTGRRGENAKGTQKGRSWKKRR